MFSGFFGQTFCGKGRIPNELISFSTMENVLLDPLINSENFRKWNISTMYVKFKMRPSYLMGNPHHLFNSVAYI